MKGLKSVFIVLVCLFSFAIPIIANENNVVNVPNGVAYQQDGVDYLPLRFISEALDADLKWYGSEKVAVMSTDVFADQFYLDTPYLSRVSLLDDDKIEYITLSNSSILLNGVSYVPSSYVTEKLNCTLNYIDVNKEDYKDYTVMVFMNGSDLESVGGAAVTDIHEMIDSNFNQDLVNVLVYTIGTTYWHDFDIPSDTNMIYKVTNDGLTPLANMGFKPVGDTTALTEFIDYSIDNFPANDYILTLWNHGAGPIDGFGSDENVQVFIYNDVYEIIKTDGYQYIQSILDADKMQEVDELFADESSNLILLQEIVGVDVVNQVIKETNAYEKIASTNELFGKQYLPIYGIKSAIDDSKLDTKLEILGFDACLMGSLEVANMFSDNANYLIASEELEPSGGWNYAWLGQVKKSSNTEEICQYIIDNFKYGYRNNALTLSAIDLSKIDKVMNRFDTFAKSLTSYIVNGDNFKAFSTASKIRNKSTSYGIVPELDMQGPDLIDLSEFVNYYRDILPAESRALLDAIDEAIIYNYATDDRDFSTGLSVYYPYTKNNTVAISEGGEYLKLGMPESYIKFLTHFTDTLNGNSLIESDLSNLQPVKNESGTYDLDIPKNDLQYILDSQLVILKVANDNTISIPLMRNGLFNSSDGSVQVKFDGTLGALNGYFATFIETDSFNGYTIYQTPAILNGEDVIIETRVSENGIGTIIGAIPEINPLSGVPNKGYLYIHPGDTVTLKNLEVNTEVLEQDYDINSQSNIFNETLGESFIVPEEGLVFSYIDVTDGSFLYTYEIRDVQKNEYITGFIEYTE